MPYKSEKIKIQGGEYDRRIKLTDVQKREIKKRYETGAISQRALAKEYGVSSRLIQFIVYPEKLSENIKRRQDRGGSKIYYNKEKHAASIREHRRYKQKLFLNGDIKLKN